MIQYDPGIWGIWCIFRYHGSVFQKSIFWSAPSAILAVVLHFYWAPGEPKGDDNRSVEGVMSVWSGYTFVLGFLIVFRNNQAYSRFWEGATLIHQMRGNWLQAASNLVSFTTKKADKEEQVLKFQELMVTLVSLLNCTAIQQIAQLQDDSLEIIDCRFLSPQSLEYLRSSHDKAQTVMQWILTLIVDSERDCVLEVAPPILSRVFQEFGSGMVHLSNIKKISNVPFPFPYAQMVTTMLLLHWIFTPLLASQIMANPAWAGLMCFFTSSAFWTLFYIAQEIDQPFGDDANDLALKEMQHEFNMCLSGMLEPLSSQVPAYSFDRSRSRGCISSREVLPNPQSSSAKHQRGSRRLEASPRAEGEDGSAAGGAGDRLKSARRTGLQSGDAAQNGLDPALGFSTVEPVQIDRLYVEKLASLPPGIASPGSRHFPQLAHCNGNHHELGKGPDSLEVCLDGQLEGHGTREDVDSSPGLCLWCSSSGPRINRAEGPLPVASPTLGKSMAPTAETSPTPRLGGGYLYIDFSG